jgi:hypothetical protein
MKITYTRQQIDAAIKTATKRILPLGCKPEDYLVLSDEAPFKIANLIFKEVKQILYMNYF